MHLNAQSSGVSTHADVCSNTHSVIATVKWDSTDTRLTRHVLSTPLKKSGKDKTGRSQDRTQVAATAPRPRSALESR